MVSWVSDWAEKGGSLLNSLDNQVASFLKNDSTLSPPPVPQRKITPPTAVVKPSANNPSLTSEMKPAEIGATDAELLDFLNDPTPVEKEASAVTPVTSTGRSTLASFQPPKASPGQPQCVDPVTENRLLHNEVASLNQEIANLVKRNRRAEQESQFRMREVESLRVHVQSLQDRLKEVQRIRSASGDIGSNTQTVRKLESQVKKLTATLDQTKQALTESESKASETLKLVDISAGRIEQLQQEVSCAVRSLTAYKEKAAAVLADKEKVISDLRQQISGGPPTSPSTEDASAPDVAAVQAELQHLREETLSLRQEADKRLLAATEMEEQAFEEHASLRRTIGLLEQQLQREKELRNEADAEILDLQRRLGSEEQRVARVKTDLQSAEAELARMRRVLAEGGGGGGGSASASPVASSRNGAAASSADAEQILAMEARIRQLSDSLVTKQDALDATLAQNHNLKIRLDRLEAESDARLLTDGRSGATFPGGGSQLPQMSHGFARLHLIDTSLPSWVRSIVVSLDAFMIRLVAHLRRRPLIRLLLIVYLFLFHVWLFLGLFFLTPSPPPQ
uniref:Leucine zipper transcription factor-like protein 1 n=1 Tax=Mesocestoides corti TaxID=53468 RepID=A0A5K3F9C5_MESCO